MFSYPLTIMLLATLLISGLLSAQSGPSQRNRRPGGLQPKKPKCDHSGSCDPESRTFPCCT
ncbi:hypothetical protein PGT21_013532 [Puccinia graminis f. sp. tritici]|uniref:Uncharacterized protein n=1 Tax=Puccinia graminis f. sp. tritici TaxID=56615 RepID=A0A5B0PQY8_PUCGR|nr:hypothetical protein PGT21_013532 [Puccinia graminis f. sp. tritici]KAA1112370.1 hypothetical protein PGTUg99_012946 [Puccinia graminis f. sp. tritici]